MKTQSKRAVLYTHANDIPHAFDQLRGLEDYCMQNSISIVEVAYDYWNHRGGLYKTMDLLFKQLDQLNPIDYLIIPTKEIRGYNMRILHAVLTYCSTELVVVEYKDLK